MSGKKRSEIQGAAGRARTHAVLPSRTPRRSATAGGEYRQALCPVCGTAHGYKRVHNGDLKNAGPGELVNYWAWLHDRERELGHGDNQPFGIIQEIGRGKGHSLGVVGYFNPDDDPDMYFPLVRGRLILAVRRWIARGWLKLNDLEPD